MSESQNTPPGEPRELSSKDYSEDLLSQFGLDVKMLVRAIVIAVVSGILAAVLDEALSLPTQNVAFTLGGVIGVLNGLNYSCFKRCADGACFSTGVLNGWLATMAWYFTMQIIVDDAILIAGMDWFEATITGIVAGAVGFAWFLIVHTVSRQLSR